MRLTEIPAPDFDLEKTLNSGQVFHWEKIDNGFIGAIGERAIYLEQAGDRLKAGESERQLDRLKRSSSNKARTEGLAGRLSRYFALDHPLAEICASFPSDPIMNAARDFCRGLRIIRQPKWECLAMFICSSMKQVAHIRQISRKLRERFGEAGKVDGHLVHTFPSARRLAESSEKELRECALGYRAKNLLATARLVGSGEASLEGWSALSDVALREKLCELPGVGAKVANCVMLFAYERLRAFPIDVWIERVLRENYFPRARKLNAVRLQAFTQKYFGDHGGYAQQYLFHHARMASRRRAIEIKRPHLMRNGEKGRGGSPSRPRSADLSLPKG
jgi:N-glycosylase/DNA lyase